MQYSQELVDKIYNYTSLSVKVKIDRLLEMDSEQYMNCGIDTSKTDKQTIKRNSKYIYKTIKKIDEPTGSLLLDHLD
jgi:hypothetical protein